MINPKILLTSGNDGVILATIHSLRTSMKCTIILVSSKPYLSQFVDEFIEKERRKSEHSLIRDICKKRKINLIIPHSKPCRLALLENPPTAILSASRDSIITADNKIRFFEICRELSIPVAAYTVVTTSQELEAAVKLYGYPTSDVVVKPVESRGSRGFRIVTKHIKYKDLFYSERGDTHKTRLTNLLKVLGKKFQPLIVMEYLPGKEYSVDCIISGDIEQFYPRERTKIVNGLTHYGKMTSNSNLIQYSRKLAKKLGLTTVFGFQFKENKDGTPVAIECNPRIQGTMLMTILSGSNIIGACAQYMLGQTPTLGKVDWNAEFTRLPSGMIIGKRKAVLDLNTLMKK